MTGPTPETPAGAGKYAALLGRSAMGGLLMGLANLVPGISGGTMLLAAGVYPNFITGVAEVTTLKFRPASLVVLGGVGSSAAVAILLLAGVVKDLVVDHRWAMYSLFIGLTLGGVPMVRNLIGRFEPASIGGVIAGFLGMSALAVAQMQGVGGVGGSEASAPMFLVAGIAGASAMILPGVSGGYLLLVMGMYVPILSGIDAFKDGLKAMDVAAMLAPALGVVLPTGIGVLAGIAGVSNVLKWLLQRWEKATLGVLLGLLIGAVVGLWPFVEGVPPELGTTWKGQLVTETFLQELDAEDYPTRSFAPTPLQAAGSVALIGVGLLVTLGVARLGQPTRS